MDLPGSLTCYMNHSPLGISSGMEAKVQMVLWHAWPLDFRLKFVENFTASGTPSASQWLQKVAVTEASTDRIM